MNSVNLIGNLTKDPEVKQINETLIANFNIAVNGYNRTDFLNCKAFKKQAEFIGNYCVKGNKIAIEGSIQTGDYEKDGKKVYYTEIIANRVESLTPKPKEEIPF